MILEELSRRSDQSPVAIPMAALVNHIRLEELSKRSDQSPVDIPMETLVNHIRLEELSKRSDQSPSCHVYSEKLLNQMRLE